MILIQHPSALHTVFNPCIIKFEQVSPSELKARIYIVEGHRINDSDIDNYITIEREFMNGYAVFDIRKSLRSLIGYRFNALPQIIPIVDSPCWIDENFFLEYTIFDENWDIRFTATAINAVAQIQESSNLSTMIGHFMTRFDKLKKYEGYPLEIVTFAFREGPTYIRFNGENFTNVDANVFVIPINGIHTSIEIGNQNYDMFLRDNAGRIITANNGYGITLLSVDDDYKQFLMPIENPTLPENPFYVRWLNRQGGYDYWMFSYRQFFNRNIASPQVFIPETTDQETVSGFESLYSLTAEEFVRVGAQGLSSNEFDCLSKLPYSPKVEWFDESTQKFKTLIIQKGDSERDNRNILSELEFTFKLPTPQLQF